MEERVSELEEENSCLRQALNLPPANRAPLGKGPTGKDKPKSIDDGTHSHQHSSRDSSSVDSPPSTRANSLSPPNLAASMRTSPRAVQVLDGSNWEQSLLLPEHSDSHMSSATSTPYQLPPVNAPVPSKVLHYPSYSNSIPPSSRNSVSSGMYMPNSQQNYSHSTDRPMGGAYSSGYVMRNDVRQDSQQQQYSYSQQSFPTSSTDSNHNMTTSSHQSTHSQAQRDPFPHRRSLTDPQGYRTIVNQFPHLPNPAHGLTHGIRLPSPPRLQDSSNNLPCTVYGNDGR